MTVGAGLSNGLKLGLAAQVPSLSALASCPSVLACNGTIPGETLLEVC